MRWKGFQGALKSANTLVYSKAVLSGQEKLDPGSVTLNGTAISTTVGYITSLGANITVAIEGSFEVMTNANDTITADWGLYDVSGGNVYIFPKGYDINGSCSLRYNVNSSFTTDPTFYALTTTGC